MIGTRRAIALLILSFFVIQFGMTAWLGPDELFAVNLGLALCYGLAFFGLAAEWFWARWFAMGVGNFGSLMLLVLFKVGFEPIFVFFGVTHLLVVLCLMGEGMAAKYEYSEKTAERWNFQEDSMALMRRAVKSAGSTLPLLILYALAPRGEWLQWAMLGTGVLGFVALIRGKTWGPLLLGATGAVCLLDGLGVFGPPTIGFMVLGPNLGSGVGSGLGSGLGLGIAPALYGKAGIFAGGLLLVLVPFIGPMLNYLRGHGRKPAL